jgi:hypothetical protein
VGKDESCDRAISDRRRKNWHERDETCPRLGHGALLTRMSLDRGEDLVMQISDLPDFSI